MKKTIVTALMIMFITSVSIASEKTTTIHSQNTELATVQNLELATFKLSPFCMAIVKGDIETVKKMIELGSDVNKKSLGMTPLMYAARYNRVDIINILVKKGAKIKVKNEKGYTAMKFAKLSNATEAIAVLEELS